MTILPTLPAGQTRIKWWVLVSPLVFAMHDLEEFITMPSWMGAHPDIIPEQLRAIAPRTPTVLITAFVVIFVVYALWAFLAVRASRRSVATYVFALLVMARLTNAIMHISVSTYLWGYSPGVITALVVVLPFSVLLLRQMLRAKWIDWPALHVLFFGGIVLQVTGTVGLLLLAHWLAG